MSRSQRLFNLLQILRRHRYAVTGALLASELGISLRTLYRDIVSLQEQGADIEGEPGLGYVLRPGFMLPPLMFSEEEIEALVLGSRWVTKHADSRLGEAARNALAKITAVLPSDLRINVESSPLLVGPHELIPIHHVDLSLIRHAIRREKKLDITYCDVNDSQSSRVIWPFALGFFEQVRIVVEWCEWRQQFRHFRADRILAATELEDRYPHRRLVLLREWRELQGIPDQ